MSRFAMRMVMGLCLVLLAACGGETRTVGGAAEREVASAVPAPSSDGPTAAPPMPRETGNSQRSTPPLTRAPSAADKRLISDFVSFAVDPSPETASRLPWANAVALGLSRDIRATLEVSDAPDTAAWVLTAEHFRAYTGPFSALALVQRHVGKVGSDSVGGRGAFQVSVGEHPHCASPPVLAPREFNDYRRVSVQPSDSSIGSCLEWFTIDLFLDEQGSVAAVTLDIWEP